MPSFETTRRVAFTPRQMYDLVADVEKYPEFLPLCETLSVKSRSSNGANETILATMGVGYKAIRESFTSRVTLDPGNFAVRAELVEGPFRQLDNRWRFIEAPGGADVHFFIAYEFSSFVLQMLVGTVFDQAVRRYTQAFEERARIVYGSPGTDHLNYSQK